MSEQSNISFQQAEHRLDQIEAFNAELAELSKQDILTLSAEQSQRLKHYHNNIQQEYSANFDLDINPQNKQFSMGMKVASFLGALAMAASLLFMFYQFWGYLSTGLQVTVLVVAPVVFLGLSLYLSSKEQHAYFGKIAALVCYASFVLNLSMLGQIFNITPSSNAFLIWAFMGGVLAYACNARLLLFFAIASLSCFIAMRLGAWNGVYWIDFGDRPENFFLPALICFGIPIFVRHHNYFGFAVVYRVCAMLMLFLPILILSFSGGMSYLTWEADIIEGLYQVIGIIFAGVFIWFGIKYRWTDLMYTGNTFFVLFLYTKMFTWWWDWMPKYAFFFVLGLVALLLLVVMKRLKFSAKHAGGSQ